ncbi:polyprenyl synthetase family protein [Jatrophihabitans fulvus]
MTTGLDRTRPPAAIDAAREVFDAPLRAAVEGIADPRMRLIAGYQMGFWDAAGEADASGRGKAVRPALALLAARAVSGSPQPGVPGAVAVELVHNFSLLHDDIIDRDVERRHRPTGWVVYGEGQAILAGTAMLTAAVESLAADAATAPRTLPILLSSVQHLISGQSRDIVLEGDDTASIEQVLSMEEGKTSSLIMCALALGAAGAGAPAPVVEQLTEAGRRLGLAFQIVDDVLGIVGDAAATGKSASSDVRAGKRSVPVVMALRSGTDAGAQLGALLTARTPETDDEVAHAVGLITASGALDRARAEAEQHLTEALNLIESADLADADAAADLRDVARFLVRRNW